MGARAIFPKVSSARSGLLFSRFILFYYYFTLCVNAPPPTPHPTRRLSVRLSLSLYLLRTCVRSGAFTLRRRTGEDAGHERNGDALHRDAVYACQRLAGVAIQFTALGYTDFESGKTKYYIY